MNANMPFLTQHQQCMFYSSIQGRPLPNASKSRVSSSLMGCGVLEQKKPPEEGPISEQSVSGGSICSKAKKKGSRRLTGHGVKVWQGQVEDIDLVRPCHAWSVPKPSIGCRGAACSHTTPVSQPFLPSCMHTLFQL